MANHERYDLTAPKESQATIYGVILLIVYLLSRIIPHELTSDQFYSYTIPIRIAVAIYSYRLAKRLNRTTWWAFLGFFLPAIVLIIMGQLKKLK